VKKLLVKASMILKFGGLYLKVITITPFGGNQYVFDCKELESKHPMILTVNVPDISLATLVDKKTNMVHTSDLKDIAVRYKQWSTKDLEAQVRLQRDYIQHPIGSIRSHPGGCSDC
jgi:hypothetical protein